MVESFVSVGLLSTPIAPIMKSLVLDVVMLTLADAESPVLVLTAPSKGETVFAPLIANAKAAQDVLESLFIVMVIVADPAVALMAYHVSK